MSSIETMSSIEAIMSSFCYNSLILFISFFDLKDSVVLKYSPRRPYEFCQYISRTLPAASSSFQSPIAPLKSKDVPVNETYQQAVTSQAVVSAKVRPYARASLQKAVHDSGGMANLLFLFAKVSSLCLCFVYYYHG